MKRTFFSLVALCLSMLATAQPANTPELEFVMQLRVTCSSAEYVGDAPAGTRLAIPITGGTFEGPQIKGIVLRGGADYQLGHKDAGRTDLEAIYNIRTDDGVTIHVRNMGMIASNNGKPYFYTAPKFEAPLNSRYAWLNNAIYVCRPDDKGMKDGVVLNVWRVQDKYDFNATIGDIKPVPRELFQPAQKQGRLETFYYNAVRNGKTLKKRAQVYVPYGYNKKDRKTKYNVVYLMHGGGDNSTSFFRDPRSPLPLTNVLDHLIQDGKMKPVLVVTPTFYPDDENIGANRMEDAIALTRDFHKELQNELIPSVEKAYNTYLNGKDSAAVTASREHRAYGGFSMGALSTWFQLAYGVSAVKHFIPLSGDLWVYDAEGKKQDSDTAARWINNQLAATSFANDFQVYGYTGTDDVAGNPQKNLIRSLISSAPLFHYDTPDANLRFSMKQKGKHYYGDINEYLYYCLPLIWK